MFFKLGNPILDFFNGNFCFTGPSIADSIHKGKEFIEFWIDLTGMGNRAVKRGKFITAHLSFRIGPNRWWIIRLHNELF